MGKQPSYAVPTLSSLAAISVMRAFRSKSLSSAGEGGGNNKPKCTRLREKLGASQPVQNAGMCDTYRTRVPSVFTRLTNWDSFTGSARAKFLQNHPELRTERHTNPPSFNAPLLSDTWENVTANDENAAAGHSVTTATAGEGHHTEHEASMQRPVGT
uniref:Siroheme synthase n=1 Tax=Lygus hesperus TaxID=30085 RepID=A0A0A9YTA1_LYGHE